MNLYGATIYVRFDTEDERFTTMMDRNHKNYKHIPRNLILLRNEMQEKYESIVPMDFRYFYALGQFELMGVLTHYEDAIDMVLELEEKLKKTEYKTMITAGFGTVCLPRDIKTMRPIDVLNQIMGHGVYSAFEFFKEKKKRKKVLP